MSPRTASPEKRRAILDAALEVFGEKGFHGASVPDLASYAGVGAGTIYRYFDSKEALVNVLYRDWKQTMAEILMADYPIGEPFRVQFHHIWSSLAQFALQHPQALAFMELHHHASYLDDESRALESQLNGAIIAFIAMAQTQQILKDLPAPVLNALVHGSFVGLVRESKGGAYSLTPEIIAAAEEAVWAAIRR